MGTVVAWIAARVSLRDGLSEEDATAIMWTLTSPEVHLMLRDTCAWSRARYQQWLRDTVTEALLDAP